MDIKTLFWEKIWKTSSCWIWTGARHTEGYGHLKYKKKQYRAHRLAWELYKGSIPENMCVCHSCDNPPCCNPDHLFLGTHQDNMYDAKCKGRIGPKHKINKATPFKKSAMRHFEQFQFKLV